MARTGWRSGADACFSREGRVVGIHPTAKTKGVLPSSITVGHWAIGSLLLGAPRKAPEPRGSRAIDRGRVWQYRLHRHSHRSLRRCDLWLRSVLCLKHFEPGVGLHRQLVLQSRLFNGPHRLALWSGRLLFQGGSGGWDSPDRKNKGCIAVLYHGWSLGHRQSPFGCPPEGSRTEGFQGYRPGEGLAV